MVPMDCGFFVLTVNGYFSINRYEQTERSQAEKAQFSLDFPILTNRTIENRSDSFDNS